LVVGRARDGDRHRNAAFLLARSPERLTFRRLRQLSARRAPAIRHRATLRVGDRRRDRGALADFHVARIALRLDRQVVRRRWRRWWRRRRWRWRRHVLAHARMPANANLPIPVIAELIVVGEPRITRLLRHVPADADAPD